MLNDRAAKYGANYGLKINGFDALPDPWKTKHHESIANDEH